MLHKESTDHTATKAGDEVNEDAIYGLTDSKTDKGGGKSHSIAMPSPEKS